MSSPRVPRIVILGGGFAGGYAAKAAASHPNTAQAEVVLIDRNNYLLFYPLLIEAGVGTIEARHVVVPIRKFIKKEKFVMAEVLEVELEDKTITYQTAGGDCPTQLSFDHLVISLGSITKIPEIPGLKEFGFQVKTLNDAMGLRDRAIQLLELANTLEDPARRRKLLTFVTVGANYTGVEFAGEFFAFLQEAAREYPNVHIEEIQMRVLEHGSKILAGTAPKLAEWCHKTLQERGVQIQTGSTITEVGNDYTVTDKGERISTRTVVWAAGIAPNPLLGKIKGLPLNSHGYIDCEADLSVKGLKNIWAIGDLATVPSPEGKPFVATAQTASRQGPAVMRNIGAAIAGNPTKPFNYKVLGSFAAIGKKQAAAEVLGLKFTGFIGWVLYRGTYLMKMPSLGMKARLVADWTTEIVFKNEPVQLGFTSDLQPYKPPELEQESKELKPDVPELKKPRRLDLI